MSEAGSKPDDPLDYAIVGAGVSGLYVAWRLLDDAKRSRGAKRPPRIKIFEASGRTGGRLYSAQAPGVPGLACELGGMRYLDSHRHVRMLVEQMGLPTIEQVLTGKDGENIIYLRRRTLRERDLTNPAALPYHLSHAEQGVGVRELVPWAVKHFIPNIDELKKCPGTLDAHLRDVRIGDTPLYQLGFWNLMLRAMTPEAHALTKALVGYDVLASNANALDLIREYFGFGSGVRYHMLSEGYEKLPHTLEQWVRRLEAQVRLDCRIARVARDGTCWRVSEYAAHGSEVSGSPHHYAKAVILALPRRSLELLDRDGPLAAPELQEQLRSVQPVPLYKMFVGYPYPWWEAARGVTQGRSLSDLPLRQCYYWGSGPESHHGPRPSLVMMYNDLSNADFWGAISEPKDTPWRKRGDAIGRPQPKFFQTQQPGASHSPGADPSDWQQILQERWKHADVPSYMLEEVDRQLRRMHGVRYAPEPYTAACMDWADDPYGGGVHLWRVGYQSWIVERQMVKPREDFYICGEAYSRNQTWVEGALETAEQVLEHLGVEPHPATAPAPCEDPS